MQQIKPGIYFEDAYLGVTSNNHFSIAELASALKLPVDHGVLIDAVTPNGPADQAGLRGGNKEASIRSIPVRTGGDIILSIDGESLRDFDAMITYLVNRTTVGQVVTLTILRDGKEMQVQVKLGERPK